jgi:hypothetical protein
LQGKRVAASTKGFLHVPCVTFVFCVGLWCCVFVCCPLTTAGGGAAIRRSAKLMETRCVVLSKDTIDDVGYLTVRFWARSEVSTEDAVSEYFGLNATWVAVNGYDNKTAGTKDEEKKFIDGYKLAEDDERAWYKCYYDPDQIETTKVPICGTGFNTSDPQYPFCATLRARCKQEDNGLECMHLKPGEFVSMRKPLSGAFVAVTFLMVVTVIGALGTAASVKLRPEEVSRETFIRYKQWVL